MARKDKDDIIRNLKNELKDYEAMKKKVESLEKQVLKLLLENKALNEALQNMLK